MICRHTSIPPNKILKDKEHFTRQFRISFSELLYSFLVFCQVLVSVHIIWQSVADNVLTIYPIGERRESEWCGRLVLYQIKYSMSFILKFAILSRIMERFQTRNSSLSVLLNLSTQAFIFGERGYVWNCVIFRSTQACLK